MSTRRTTQSPAPGKRSNSIKPESESSDWEKDVLGLTYNQSRTALELIIAQLQSEELEVEAMAALHQRANAYLRHCRSVLQQVEQDVTKLELNDLKRDI